ncbi:MAG: alpha/beta hydrolase [Clostridia bacterium]|nr:alpha/beta hydrolase [Clostridia bacterium]
MKRMLALLLAGLMLAGLTPCLAEENQTEGTNAMVKTVSTSDVTMDYVVFGSGEKVFVILPGLSIHSVMGSAEAIAAAYQSFAEEYTVYVFDRAKNLKEGYTVRDMAEDTAKAMEALHIEGADVFGASQGGMMAQYLAIDHPALVHKLILGSTLAKPNDTFLQVVDTWISLAEARDEEGLLASFVDEIYGKAALEAYRDYLITSNRGITEEEYQRFIILASACKTFDCYDALSSIRCPVLVLGSEGDQVVTAEGSREIAQALNCTLYLYDAQYGHGVYDEAPDYKQQCLDFLQSDEQ